MTTPFNATATAATTPNPDNIPPQTHPFPQPQTFTFLPQLYTLLSHLSPLNPQLTKDSNSSSTSRASRSPTLTRRPPATADSMNVDSLTLTQTRSRDEAVETKDLPALVYPLRQQIEHAKEVVRGLPDVGRSVAEQEEEIRELEGRIGTLKGRLGALGALAAGDGVVIGGMG